MKTMALEVGLERVWSDSDALSQEGYAIITAAAPGTILREAAKLETAFERLWTDEDALQATEPRKMKMAA